MLPTTLSTEIISSSRWCFFSQFQEHMVTILMTTKVSGSISKKITLNCTKWSHIRFWRTWTTTICFTTSILSWGKTEWRLPSTTMANFFKRNWMKWLTVSSSSIATRSNSSVGASTGCGLEFFSYVWQPIAPMQPYPTTCTASIKKFSFSPNSPTKFPPVSPFS